MTVLLLAAAALQAQQRTVAGTVSDVKGSPLAGVVPWRNSGEILLM